MTQNGTTEHFNEDSIDGFLNYKAKEGFLPFANPITGLGTSRDPLSYTRPVNPYILEDNEIYSLYSSSNIAQRIVNTYPCEYADPFNYSDRGNLRLLQKINKRIKELDLYQIIRTALLEANLIGSSYLFLGLDDGNSIDQPLELNKLKKIQWIKPVNKNLVQIDVSSKNVNRISYSNPEHYLILPGSEIPEKSNQYQLKFHHSRVVRFEGLFYAPSMIDRYTYGKHLSSLQAAYDGFAMFVQALGSASAMLNDYSVFTYKLAGLSNLVKQGKYDTIYSRFAMLQMSKSVIKGLAIDRNTEEIDYTERSFSGVDQIISRINDYMVAETGIVRYKILGSAQDQGLGGVGRGIQERMTHAENTLNWVKTRSLKQLEYFNSLILHESEGINAREEVEHEIEIRYPFNLQITPFERAELEEKFARNAALLIDKGVIEPIEVRQTYIEKSSEDLYPSWFLDETITQKMIDKRLNLELPEEQIDWSNVDGLDEWLNGSFLSDAKYHHMLVWFSDSDGSNKHRTPIAVGISEEDDSKVRSKAIAAARKKCKRHCEVAYAVRHATQAEIKTAASGNWIRTGAKGEKPGYKGIKGVGTPLGGHSKDEQEEYNVEIIVTKDQTAEIIDMLENFELSDSAIDEAMKNLENL